MVTRPSGYPPPQPSAGPCQGAALPEAKARQAGGAAMPSPANPAARKKWREQGLEWLEADLLAQVVALDEGGDGARDVVHNRLIPWMRSPDLSAIRESAALKKLSIAERKRWQRLWAKVEELLAKKEEEAK